LPTTDPPVDPPPPTPPLDAYLTATAVEAGEVPVEVADWLAEGAWPGETFMPEDVDLPSRRAGRWEITNLGAATWAFRKIAAARAELTATDAAYTAELARLNAWREQANGPHARTVYFLDERLTAWGLAERDRGGRATIGTPAGEVRTRKPGAPWKLTVTDKAALIAYALANGCDGLTQPAPAGVSDLAKHLTVVDKDGDLVCLDPESGEVVPGVAATATAYTATVVPS